MPSTRRTLLRTGLLGVFGALAGCSGKHSPSENDTVTTAQFTTSPTTGTTTRSLPDEMTSERPTTIDSSPKAIEFAHRTPVLDSGLGESDGQFFARRVGIRPELDDIDVSAAKGDVSGQDLAAVEQFVAATNLKETTLLAVQVRVPSSEYGLDFAFLDPWSPAQVAVQTQTVDARGSADSGPAISTLLIRMPARMSEPSITIADLAGVRDDFETSTSSNAGLLTTFDPPNDLRSESLTGKPLDSAPTFSGAIVPSPEDAERLLPETDPYAEFVRETDFGDSYLLGVQTRISSGGIFAWPRVVTRDGDRIAVDLWQYPFTGGPNAEFERFVLARIAGEAPERGTATIRRPAGTGSPIIDLSTDPSEW